MMVCEKKVVNDKDVDLIRKWVNDPKAISISIRPTYGENYRVNVFTVIKSEDCVVDKITLSKSYYVCVRNNVVVDKTR